MFMIFQNTHDKVEKAAMVMFMNCFAFDIVHIRLKIKCAQTLAEHYFINYPKTFGS